MNFSGTSVSRLMFKCVRPASFNWGSFLVRVTPLVVKATDSMPSISDRDPKQLQRNSVEFFLYTQ